MAAEENKEEEEQQFILFNVDSIELSPRVQNPIGRSWIVQPKLYAAAEAAGCLNVPGQDVEDRQYQIDFKRISISTGKPSGHLVSKLTTRWRGLSIKLSKTIWFSLVSKTHR